MDLKDLSPRADPKAGARGGGIDYPMESSRARFLHSNLFVFLMGQIITFLGVLVFFAVAWGKLSQQFVETMEWRAATQARLERMDKEGTIYSHYHLESDVAKMLDADARIKALEDQTRKIDVMKATLDRLDSAIMSQHK